MVTRPTSRRSLVIATALLLSRIAVASPGDTVAAPTGVLLAYRGSNPYVWLSGRSPERRAANQILPWAALERVHLIRTLGTPEASAAMVTVRLPGQLQPACLRAAHQLLNELLVQAVQTRLRRRVLSVLHAGHHVGHQVHFHDRELHRSFYSPR